MNLRSGFVYLLILALQVQAVMLSGCDDSEGKMKEIEYRLQADLPAGTSIEDVQVYLAEHGFAFAGVEANPAESASGEIRMYKTITASLPIDDTIFKRNSKITSIFYFDDEKLSFVRVFETYSSL